MARQNQTEINDEGRINILQRCTANTQEKLKESTLIKMLTKTLWIYERDLTLSKKKKKKEKKQHSARAEVTICQMLSRCTVSQAHSLHICTQPPTHGPSLVTLFTRFFKFCFCVFLLYCFILKFNYAEFSEKLKENRKTFIQMIF